jgi:CheY-like chemotaxis protein
MNTKPDQLLLIVEDSPEDYEATVRALTKTGFTSPLMRCEDGDDALNFLYRRGRFSAPELSPRPSMILLDLNLPGTDGRQVLAAVKSDENLKTIPVLIFSGSKHESDVSACYEAGANSYIPKPLDMSGLQETMSCIKDFWFETAMLPE